MRIRKLIGPDRQRGELVQQHVHLARIHHTVPQRLVDHGELAQPFRTRDELLRSRRRPGQRRSQLLGQSVEDAVAAREQLPHHRRLTRDREADQLLPADHQSDQIDVTHLRDIRSCQERDEVRRADPRRRQRREVLIPPLVGRTPVTRGHTAPWTGWSHDGTAARHPNPPLRDRHRHALTPSNKCSIDH